MSPAAGRQQTTKQKKSGNRGGVWKTRSHTSIGITSQLLPTESVKRVGAMSPRHWPDRQNWHHPTNPVASPSLTQQSVAGAGPGSIVLYCPLCGIEVSLFTLSLNNPTASWLGRQPRRQCLRCFSEPVRRAFPSVSVGFSAETMPGSPWTRPSYARTGPSRAPDSFVIVSERSKNLPDSAASQLNKCVSTRLWKHP